MKNLLAIIISISLHLIALYLIINIEIKAEIKEKEKFEIKIVRKDVESKESGTRDYNEPVLNSSEHKPFEPQKRSYIDPVLNSPLPEIDLSSSFENTISYTSANADPIASLESLIEKPQIEMPEEDNSSKMTINWSGEGRKGMGDNSIDFSTFPRDIFTGIDITIQFNVSEKGDVYNSYIVPPGSGSVEFDIMVLEYIDSFTFEEGEATTGVIKIIYE